MSSPSSHCRMEGSAGRFIEPDLNSYANPSRGWKAIRKLFLSICVNAGTPLASAAYSMMKEGDFAGLINLSVEPFFYSWSGRLDDFELDWQIACFFKKYDGFDLGIDKEEAGFAKWLKAEASCRKTNQYFRARWSGSSKPLPHRVEEVLYLARCKISRMLGTIGGPELAYLREHCRHGPGGDLSIPKRNASAYGKYHASGDITAACESVYDDIFGSENDMTGAPLECQPDRRQELAHEAEIVSESRLSFVPKSAKIDRAICVEPRWNVYVQLGIGDLIAQRLRRHGIDISDQGLNQRAAAEAGVERLATIDLSSASDTVSTNLVIDLLADADPLWLDLILRTRTPHTNYRGKSIYLEKISSMGNGYTFPLETLIFYALSWATCRFHESARTSRIAVYGDDIIVPRSSASALIEVLEAFGFSVNTEKSFLSGDFFESCGEDYWRGDNIRPFFVSEKASTLSQMYSLQNQVVAWANVGFGQYHPARLELAACVSDEIPPVFRKWGPTTHSGVLHSAPEWWLSLSRTAWSCKRSAGWDGFFIMALIPLTVKVRKYGYRGLLMSKLHGGTDCQHWVTTPGVAEVVLQEVYVPNIEDFIVQEHHVSGGTLRSMQARKIARLTAS